MESILNQILPFLDSIALPYSLEPIEEVTFLPGLQLKNGVILIDTDKLLYPGDILHEAGHLACTPPDMRNAINGTLENNDTNAAGEMMAIAWSYAATVHLNIDPYIVFHENGYKGGAAGIVLGYLNGNTMGIPMLQLYGMCYDYNNAVHLNQTPFPHMQKWVCEFNPFEEYSAT